MGLHDRGGIERLRGLAPDRSAPRLAHARQHGVNTDVRGCAVRRTRLGAGQWCTVTSSTPTAPPARAHRRPGLVWGTAAAAYAVAVLHRSSLGVAGIEASERFGTGASSLATFVVVQLVVYAGLQVPVGLVLDRLGPRRLIASGAALMAVGQLVMALASSVELALLARVLIGAGDALTFVSVIRLLPAWFPLPRVPLFTQLTGIVGMLGQVLAAVPLVLLLHGRGWPTAFVGAALLGAAVSLTVALVVRDSPGADGARPASRRPRDRAQADAVAAERAAGGPEPAVPSVPAVPDLPTLPTSAPTATAGAATPPPRARRALAAVLREPGTWLGFWIHFIGGYSSNAMVLLWASPFLLSGEGRSPAEVSALLTLTVVAALVAGPPIGHFTGRRPERRMTVVVVVAGAIGLAWAALLLPPRPLPLWALALFMVVIAVGAPASLIGLDIARAHNPRERMGTATGVANAGGFVGALLMMSGVGLVLDLRAGGAAGVAAPLDDYRVALATAGVAWALGAVGLAVSARRVARAAPAAAAPFLGSVRHTDVVDSLGETP
jgi:sugar phosphate permease